MKYCSKCGQELPEEAKFCGGCGSVLSDQGGLASTVPMQADPGDEPAAIKIKTPKKRRNIIIVAAILAVLLSLGGFWAWRISNTDARCQKKLDLAVKYLSDNNFDKAVLAYNDAIEINPKEVDAYQGLAKVYTLQGNYDKAEDTYERGMKAVEQPKIIILRLAFAGMYIDKSDLQQAEQLFQSIVDENRNCIDAYQGLALVYQQQGDNDKARAILEKAIQENSQDYRAYNNLAQFCADNSDKDQALSNIVKSLDLEFNQQQAYHILDGLYKGRWNELIDKADSLADSKAAAMLKFYACYSDENYSAALSQYQTALENDTANHKARVMAAVCMFKNNQKDEATEIIDKLTGEEINASIMADVAYYYMLAGDIELAQDYASRALGEEGLTPDVILLLAEINQDKEQGKLYAAQYLVFYWQPAVIVTQELQAQGLQVPDASATVDNESKASSKTGREERNAWFPIRKESKWGFMDKTGKVVIEPQYDLVHDFSEGLAAVMVDDKWGFINEEGIMVIPPQFGWIGTEFSEGLACVNKVGLFEDAQWEYIDKTGNVVFQTNELQGYSFHDGLAIVDDQENYVLINREGKQVAIITHDRTLMHSAIKSSFGNLDLSFSEGLCPIQTDDNKWGYIDKNLNMVIQPQYSYAGFFSEGLAFVGFENDTGGFIDKSGHMKFNWPRAYQPYSGLSEGLIVIVDKNNKYGFINNQGKIVISPQYDYADPFFDGMAFVCSNGAWGFINKTGHMIIHNINVPLNDYDEYHPRFRNGLCLLLNPDDAENLSWDHIKYIDKNGKVIWSSDNSSTEVKKQ